MGQQEKRTNFKSTENGAGNVITVSSYITISDITLERFYCNYFILVKVKVPCPYQYSAMDKSLQYLLSGCQSVHGNLLYLSL